MFFVFLTWLPDPQIAVIVFYDMLRGELLHVDESQTGKGGENKETSRTTVIRSRKLLVVNGQQFIVLRNSRITSFSTDLIPINGSLAIHSLASARLVIFFRHFI